VFASKQQGGLGLLDLYTEQGLSQIKLLISHLRARSYLSNTIIVLLEAYQVSSGMLQSPLTQTNSHPYIESRWVQSIRQFLNDIQGQIHTSQILQLHPLREQDQPIMNEKSNHQFTTSELQAINACRLFLQVTSIAEISDNNGTTILSCALHGSIDSSTCPILWTYSTSKLKWPVQSYPSTKAWKLWKKYLLTHLNSNLKFDISLGKWYRTCHQHRNWKYTSYQDTIIQTTSKGNNTFKLSTSQTRQSKTYIRQSTDAVVMHNITTPTIPNFITNNSIKCNSCNTANNLVLYFKPSSSLYADRYSPNN
jgi:hypothetical protein